MAFGVTDNGFNLKRFEDIKADLQSAYSAAFGDIRLDDESNFGQLINVQGETLALLWEAVQESYFSKYPSSANGVALDWAVELNNIKRLPATGTNVNVGIEISGTTANVSDSFDVIDDNGDIYRIDSEAILDLNSLNRSVLYITSDSDGTYLVYIDGFPISVTVPIPTDKSDIVTALNSQINSIVPYIETTTGSDYIILSNGDSFSVEIGFGISITAFIVKSFTNLDTGPIPANTKSISTIGTPETGIVSVLNFEAGVLGNEVETDEELRIRRRSSLAATGSATIEAIRSGLQRDIADATTVLVVENDQDITVDGMPPKSIQCILVGGDDQEIAEAIFKYKSGGIEAYGNQGDFIVIDSMGYPHIISFSRPVTIPIYVTVTVTENAEEGLQSNYQSAIRDTLSNFQFSIGGDVITQKLISELYNNITGLANVEMFVGTSPSPTLPNNIPISFDEIANIDSSNVTVILA